MRRSARPAASRSAPGRAFTSARRLCATQPVSPSPVCTETCWTISASVPIANRQRSVAVSSSCRNSAAQAERHEVVELRGDGGHGVRHAEAGAHRLRDGVEPRALTVGAADVVEDAAAQPRQRRPVNRPDVCLKRGPHFDEGLDHRRVERLPRFLLQQVDRGLGAHRRRVRALHHQRVEVIDHRQDSCAERDRLALEPGGIALTVPALVMAQDQRRDPGRERHGADDVGAHLRVRARFLRFLRRERTRFRQDLRGDGQGADIVEHRRDVNALDLALGEAERTGDSGGIQPQARNMSRGARLRIDRGRERLERTEEIRSAQEPSLCDWR